MPIDFVSRHAYSSREPQLIPFGSYQELTAPQDLLAQFGAPRAHLAGTGLAGLPAPWVITTGASRRSPKWAATLSAVRATGARFTLPPHSFAIVEAR